MLARHLSDGELLVSKLYFDQHRGDALFARHPPKTPGQEPGKGGGGRGAGPAKSDSPWRKFRESLSKSRKKKDADSPQKEKATIQKGEQSHGGSQGPPDSSKQNQDPTKAAGDIGESILVDTLRPASFSQSQSSFKTAKSQSTIETAKSTASQPGAPQQHPQATKKAKTICDGGQWIDGVCKYAPEGLNIVGTVLNTAGTTTDIKQLDNAGNLINCVGAACGALRKWREESRKAGEKKQKTRNRELPVRSLSGGFDTPDSWLVARELLDL